MFQIIVLLIKVGTRISRKQRVTVQNPLKVGDNSNIDKKGSKWARGFPESRFIVAR
jgi:hypothetical protein